VSTGFPPSPQPLDQPTGYQAAPASQRPDAKQLKGTQLVSLGPGRTGLREPDSARRSVPGSERQSLRRFIRRFVHIPWDAEDIVQEAYLRLLEHRRGREPYEIPRYLFAIARNLVVDRKRRAFREARRRESFFELGAQLDNAAPAPDELAFVDQASECLRCALDELPERARHAFLLHRFEGLRHESIAARLGVTTRTIERDIAAVLAHLKRALFVSEEP
jgi:RNA polymerase sigma-70 factor (ECF subfamily)